MPDKNEKDNSNKNTSGSSAVKYFVAGITGGALGIGYVALFGKKSNNDNAEKNDHPSNLTSNRSTPR